MNDITELSRILNTLGDCIQIDLTMEGPKYKGIKNGKNLLGLYLMAQTLCDKMKDKNE